jgi:hypothetical protein
MSETIAQSGNDSYAVSVGTSALVLVEGGGSNQSGSRYTGGDSGHPRQVTVHNAHATQVLYVGFGSDLSTANGLPIPAGTYKQFLLTYVDEVWAIASGASTSARVAVLHGKGNPA